MTLTERKRKFLIEEYLGTVSFIKYTVPSSNVVFKTYNQVIIEKYEESKHKRDKRGRWTFKGGGAHGGEFREGKMLANAAAPDAPAELRAAAKAYRKGGAVAAGKALDKRVEPEGQKEILKRLSETRDPLHGLTLGEAVQEAERRKETIEVMTKERTQENLKHARDYMKEKAAKIGGSFNLGKRVHLIMGLPGSGKSAFAERIQKAERSMIIDADEIKEKLKGFDNGLGANSVHRESAAVLGVVERALVRKGANFVLPVVGKNPVKMKSMIQRMKKAGYTVVLHHVDVPVSFSEERVTRRFLEKGRAVSTKYVREVGTLTRQSFDILRKQRVAHATVALSAHNIPGPPPIRYAVLGASRKYTLPSE